MSAEAYTIVFNGDLIDGHEPAEVQARLASLLKLDLEKVKTLFSGKRVILKRTHDKSEAVKYAKALKRVGADVKVKVTQASPAVDSDRRTAKLEAANPAATMLEGAAASRTDSSAISLAPNVGALFDPIPATPAPDLNLGQYSLADNDGSFIVDPAEIIEIELDLSTYTIAENDGRDLFESEDVTKPNVDIPDFGLAEPGALLETLQEGKEILSPDTKGMTLAMAGADLLEEDGKQSEPAPRKPDTSGMNLVPDFDS